MSSYLKSLNDFTRYKQLYYIACQIILHILIHYFFTVSKVMNGRGLEGYMENRADTENAIINSHIF